MSSCPSQDELERFAAGDRRPAALSVEDHLAICERCQRIVAELSADETLFREVGRALEADQSTRREQQFCFQSGQSFANFRLERAIYSGGQATVFEACQLDLPTARVAIKIWHRSLADSLDHRLRFERELETVRGLDHPCIVRAKDGGIEAGAGYLVMELLEGFPIDEFADQKRKSDQADLREWCQLLARVCDAVAYAHARGIIHRDLKPSNILVSREGNPKVVDFGLAKKIPLHGQPATQQITQTGQFLGTLAFASPEQLTGQTDDVDVQSDVYTLGIVAYRVCTGRMPYATAGPPAEVLANIQSAVVQAPSRWNPNIDRNLSAVLMKAIERDKRDRYRTVTALQADLQNYLSGNVIEARRNSQLHLLARMLRRNTVAAIISLVLVTSLMLAVVLGGIALVQSQRALRLSDRTLAQQRQLAIAAMREQDDIAQRAYHASITAATLANDPRSARHWLKDAPESHRGWEWHYLWQMADQTEIQFSGHDRYVECVRSAGSDRLISTSWDGTTRLWDLAGKIQLAQARLHKHVWGLAVSPDGSRAAIGDFGGQIHIVSIEDLSVLQTIQGPEYPIFGLSYSKDGNRLAGCFSKSKQSLLSDAFSTICIYDVADGSLLGSTNIESSTRGISPIDEDSWLVAGLSRSGIVSTQNGLMRELPAASSAIYDANRSRVYLAQLDRPVVAFETSSDFQSPVWTKDFSVVNELALSNDGRRLAIAGRNSTVRIVDPENGQVIEERVGHDWSVSTCSFVDNETLATGGRDKTVRVWTLAPNSSVVDQWTGHTDQIHALFPTDRLLLTGSRDGTLRCWETGSGRLLSTLNAEHEVWSVHLSPDQNRWIAGLSSGALLVGQLDLTSGELVETDRYQVSPHPGAVHDARFVDSNLAIFCTASNLLAEIDLQNGEIRGRNREHRGHIHRVGMASSGNMVSVDHDRIIVWNVDRDKVQIEMRRSIFQDDYSLELWNHQIIAGRNPGQIGIWDLDTSSPKCVLNGHSDEIYDLAIHPDGTRLVSCSADKTTKIWDLVHHRLLSVIETGDLYLTRVQFGLKGEQLYGAAHDGRILVWDRRPSNSPPLQAASGASREQ